MCDLFILKGWIRIEQTHELIFWQEFIERISRSVPIGMNKLYSLVKEPGFLAIKIRKCYYVMADKTNDWIEQQQTDWEDSICVK